MTALDALWAKADAFEGMREPGWAQWADGYVDSTLGKNLGIAPNKNPVDLTGHALTARLTHDLDIAETFYVSPEMNRLVTAAAESWPTEEQIWMEDFPSPVGWVWIPGGLTRLDIRGAMVTTDAVSWHVTGGKVNLTFWADKVHDSPHQKAKPGWQWMPRLTPWHVMSQPLASPLLLSVQMGTLLPPEISEQINWMEDPDGESLAMHIPKGWTAEELTPTAQPDPVVAWLVSALRIMATPLADVKRQGLPTNVRKDLMRRPHRFKEKAVTVIQFRRTKKELTGEPEARDWSHSWLRRGHWRKQWRGSEKTGDRRQVSVWIHDKIYDPGVGKPLLIRQHVNAFTR